MTIMLVSFIKDYVSFPKQTYCFLNKKDNKAKSEIWVTCYLIGGIFDPNKKYANFAFIKKRWRFALNRNRWIVI